MCVEEQLVMQRRSFMTAAIAVLAWPLTLLEKRGPQSGTWTTDLATKPNAALDYDWPEGSGDSELDYHNPILAKTDSTSWGSGTTNGE